MPQSRVLLGQAPAKAVAVVSTKLPREAGARRVNPARQRVFAGETIRTRRSLNHDSGVRRGAQGFTPVAGPAQEGEAPAERQKTEVRGQRSEVALLASDL